MPGSLTLSTAPENAAASEAPRDGVRGGSPERRAGAGRPLARVVVLLIAAGVLVNVHFAVLARVLSEAEYGRFVSFVSIVLLISFGGFLPVEQEMARQFQTGHRGRAVLRSSAVVSVGIAVVAACLVAGLVPWRVPSLADPQILVALLCLCLVCVVQFLVRGTLIGTGRMTAHGLILLWDAVLRLGFAGIVVAATSAGALAGGYAIALVAAIAAAHLPALVWVHRLAGRTGADSGGPTTSTRETGGMVGHLIAGSISSQILLNAPPILVAAAANAGQADLVGRFAATFTLARVLLFIVVPLQSALVPIFTRIAERGVARESRLMAGRIGLGTLAAGAVAAPAAWLAGPWVIELVFGPRYALGGRDAGLMVVGAMLYLGSVVAAQALVGAGQHRDVGVAWTVGLLVGVVVFLAVPDLVLRAELAFASGSAVSLLTAVARLWRSEPRRGARANPTPAPEGIRS
ncbi:MAG: lipopolysaccharide biosynthesis protein [Geodermatophilaceae bacterium]